MSTAWSGIVAKLTPSVERAAVERADETRSDGELDRRSSGFLWKILGAGQRCVVRAAAGRGVTRAQRDIEALLARLNAAQRRRVEIRRGENLGADVAPSPAPASAPKKGEADCGCAASDLSCAMRCR